MQLLHVIPKSSKNDLSAGPFFLKSGHFFGFPKKGEGDLPHSSPSCAPEVIEIVLEIIW